MQDDGSVYRSQSSAADTVSIVSAVKRAPYWFCLSFLILNLNKLSDYD